MNTPKTPGVDRASTPQPDYEDSADSGIHGVDGSIPEYDMVGASSCKDCAAGKCHTKFIHIAGTGGDGPISKRVTVCVCVCVCVCHCVCVTICMMFLLLSHVRLLLTCR